MVRSLLLFVNSRGRLPGPLTPLPVPALLSEERSPIVSERVRSILYGPVDAVGLWLGDRHVGADAEAIIRALAARMSAAQGLEEGAGGAFVVRDAGLELTSARGLRVSRETEGGPFVVDVPDLEAGAAEVRRMWDGWHAVLTDSDDRATAAGYSAVLTLRDRIGAALETSIEDAASAGPDSAQSQFGLWDQRAGDDGREVARREAQRAEGAYAAVRAVVELFEAHAIYGTWDDLVSAHGAPSPPGRGALTREQSEALGAVGDLDLDQFDHKAKGTDLFTEAARVLCDRRGLSDLTHQAIRRSLVRSGAWASGLTLAENRERLERRVAESRAENGMNGAERSMNGG